jgi:hypothetical protein
MTAHRHAAYMRFRARLDALVPSKLLPAEREVLQDAAEGLLLTHDSQEAAASYERAAHQLRTLISTGRWTETMALPLLDDLAAASPPAFVLAA